LGGSARKRPSVTGVSESAIEVADLVKRYPRSKTDAVGGVSFTAASGEVFGLLGPNGAGKTTTVGVLTTRVRLSAGRALVGGVDVDADPVGARRLLAVVTQRNNLDRSLTIKQNLLFHAAYHGRAAGASERADALLEQFGLTARADEQVSRFSGGQEQRVMIARALMHAPQVLFLDEPSTGLDPAARLFVWDRVRELRAGGTTVLLTTHDMAEAAALADRVGIMDKGQLLALGTPEQLTRTQSAGGTLDVTAEGRLEGLEAVLSTLPDVQRIERFDVTEPGSAQLRLRLYVVGDAARLVGPVASALADHGARLCDVAVGVPTLEDVFLQLTGRTLR